jgi:hypothetical protein
VVDRWSLSIGCALACLGCGPDAATAGESSTGSSVTTTSSGDEEETTRGSDSIDTGADPTSTTGMTTTTASTTMSATSTDEDATTFDPSPASCSEVDIDRCEEADVGQDGCAVHSGPGFRYDVATGSCADLGEYDVCMHSGVLTSPTTAWSVDPSGDVVIVQLLNTPFDLGAGLWSRCSCWHPGSPFACWACPEQGSECGGEPSCDGATTEEECAAAISDCAWVQTTVFDGVDNGCEPVSAGARCVQVLPGKDDCALAVAPDECGEWSEPAPPYVRPVDGGVEVITDVGCGGYPLGYMACWSAPGDPAACSCPC